MSFCLHLSKTVLIQSLVNLDVFEDAKRLLPKVRIYIKIGAWKQYSSTDMIFNDILNFRTPSKLFVPQSREATFVIVKNV